MMNPSDNPVGSDALRGPQAGASGLVECWRIEEVLFDYLSRELGEQQSLLVREHLRHCDHCRRQAAELQTTVDLLRAQDPAGNMAARLSDPRRRRLLRVLLHPVLDWIIRHHVVTALLAAVVALGVVLLFLTWLGAPLPLHTLWFQVRPGG